MINLTYQSINNPSFSRSIKKLMDTTTLPVKTAYTVAKIAQKLEQEIKVAGKLYADLLKKHCELTPEGNLAPQMQKMAGPDGVEVEHPIPGSFVPKEGAMAALEEEIKNFMHIPLNLDYAPLDLDALAGAKMSPNELIELEGIINQPSLNSELASVK